ncbi:hypothetical protein Gogos_014547, partial [Gossypium gossypioides]|nr:hypothetical protein [Gossypium gossypioides]
NATERKVSPSFSTSAIKIFENQAQSAQNQTFSLDLPMLLSPNLAVDPT